MKNRTIELKWGVIFSIMMLLWMALEKVTGLHGEHIESHPIFTNFVAIPAILIYVLALKDKKKNFYDGNMSYKQGLISAIITTLVVTMLSPACLYFSMTVPQSAAVISVSKRCKRAINFRGGRGLFQLRVVLVAVNFRLIDYGNPDGCHSFHFCEN